MKTQAQIKAIRKMELLRLRASILAQEYGNDSRRRRRISQYCAIKNWINHKRGWFAG